MLARKPQPLRKSEPHKVHNEPAQKSESDLMTVSEVARRLRVDDTTVRRWIKQGALKAVPLPHRGKRQAYRIKQQELDKILETTTTLE